jgi:hypothetical protein
MQLPNIISKQGLGDKMKEGGRERGEVAGRRMVAIKG